MPPPPPPNALRSLLSAVRRSPRDAELASCAAAALRCVCAAPAWDAPAAKRAADAALQAGLLPALAAAMRAQPRDTEVQTEACLALGAFALARLTGAGTSAAAAAARGGLALFAAGALERLRAADADAAAAAAAAGAGAGDASAAAAVGAAARRTAAAAAETAFIASNPASGHGHELDPAAAAGARDALAAARGLVAARQRIAADLLNGVKAAAKPASVPPSSHRAADSGAEASSAPPSESGSAAGK